MSDIIIAFVIFIIGVAVGIKVEERIVLSATEELNNEIKQSANNTIEELEKIKSENDLVMIQEKLTKFVKHLRVKRNLGKI